MEFEVCDPLPDCDEDWGDIYASMESVAQENGLELLGVIADGPDH